MVLYDVLHRLFAETADAFNLEVLRFLKTLQELTREPGQT